ncbi:hypothetical protein DXG03_007169 [Asterophora parasitica]|uniref:LigT-like protein n=1 Tax=Asterophora parasitica TaxID=117018 RepID=A0A9P7G8X3_9AGAR|nr:hypothetical protein DXG03_007169 [Asterophora parasitica]
MENAQRLSTIMNLWKGQDPSSFPSSYPTFAPHITLASFPSSSAIPAKQIRAAIPKLDEEIQVDFKSVEIGDHFFRSVYIAIAPSPALWALHEQVHTNLGIEPRTPAYPHLSLCYIDDADAALGEREKFYGELLVRIKITGNARIGLDCEGIKKDWMEGFQATEIWVADCDGPVEGWQILDKISVV